MNEEHFAKSLSLLMPVRMDWPSAVGQLILNFSMMDALVSVYLKKHLDDHEFEGTKKLHFKDRLGRVRRDLEKRGAAEAVLAGYDRWLARIEPVRELRNHIAHGHFSMVLGGPEDVAIGLDLPRDMGPVFETGMKRVILEDVLAGLDVLSDSMDEFQRVVGLFGMGGGGAEGSGERLGESGCRLI